MLAGRRGVSDGEAQGSGSLAVAGSVDVEAVVERVDGAVVGHRGGVGDVVGRRGDDHLVRGVIAGFVLVVRLGNAGDILRNRT